MHQPITVWRTAMDQKRPYLGLDDACAYMNFALEKNLFDNQLYNIVTSNYTVRDVVDSIREFAPDLSVELVDNAIMNQLSYEVSARKIQKAGFKFKGDLRTAVKDTVQLLQSRKAA